MSGNSVQQSELWEISRQLVGFNTVSAYSNMDAAEYLANLLEDSGFAVQLLKEMIQGVEKAMVLAWAGPKVAGGLIISGHTDVVPFDGQPGWTSDPLVMHTDGQRIFGRGVTDMKVFLAQAVLAAKRLPLKKLKKPLMYVFTCDEEIAGQGSERLINVIPKLFDTYPVPSVALIGEPTNFDIFPAHKGYAAFDICIRGKGGHSSAPSIGLNSIERMAEVIRLIQEANNNFLEKPRRENTHLFPESPSSVFNCAVISGGLAANMIPEICRLTASVRIAPGDQVEEILVQLQERIESDIAKSMKAIGPEYGIFIENIITTPPMRSSMDSAFCHFLSQVMGRCVERGAPYATDGGRFQQIGISSYICGPGLLEEAHQPNESIPIANFLTGLEKVEQIIYDWCIASLTHQ
jgi:acetylornithine deacetylase